MIALQDLRKRMPLFVFILLAVFCLVLLGVACACASNHPVQSIDRALSAIPAAAPLVEVWSFAFSTLVILVSLEVRRRRVEYATSPAALQRFLL